MTTLAVLTISDTGSRGERRDKSGQIVKEIFAKTNAQLVSYEVIPDETEIIKDRLIKLTDKMKVRLIITTGGTGFSSRDVTPEATRSIIERDVPGFGEIMRVEGYKKTPMAILSRGIAGIRGTSLIINLPGSSRGVTESLEIIMPVLEHGLGIITGDTQHDESTTS